MALSIKHATKAQAKSRMALIGPSGSGKTYTALIFARELAGEDGRICVIDTEYGSASKYADLFDFDVIELESFSPEQYIEAFDLIEAQDYAVCITDSLSHAWAGKDGILEFVDQTTSQSKSKNAYTEGWRKATPKHNQLVERMLRFSRRRHLIVTLRSKVAYVITTNEKGQQFPTKIGLQPVQREGLEFEFDIVADMDLDNTLSVSKTRCPSIRKAVVEMPDAAFAQKILGWLDEGAPAAPEADEHPTNGMWHPTADDITTLMEFGEKALTDMAFVSTTIRQAMQLGETQPLTKKYLREHITREQYDHLTEQFTAMLQAQVKSDEEDVLHGEADQRNTIVLIPLPNGESYALTSAQPPTPEVDDAGEVKAGWVSVLHAVAGYYGIESMLDATLKDMPVLTAGQFAGLWVRLQQSGLAEPLNDEKAAQEE